MNINSDPLDTTDILHSPQTFVRRYENVLAQLAQAQAERDAARANWQSADTDAATLRLEVARLRDVLTDITNKAAFVQRNERTSKGVAWVMGGVAADARAALRGQPAPACPKCNGTGRVYHPEHGRALLCDACQPAPAGGEAK